MADIVLKIPACVDCIIPILLIFPLKSQKILYIKPESISQRNKTILSTICDFDFLFQKNIHSNLLALAMSASDWECECNVALQNQLNIQITAVPKYYVNCKELSVTLYKIGLG